VGGGEEERIELRARGDQFTVRNFVLCVITGTNHRSKGSVRGKTEMPGKGKTASLTQTSRKREPQGENDIGRGGWVLDSAGCVFQKEPHCLAMFGGTLGGFN